MSFKKLSIWLALGLTLNVYGQGGQLPTVFVRYMAIGEKPPFDFKEEDGVRVEVPPPPGSEPPASLWIPGLKGDKKKLKMELTGVNPYKEIDPNLGDAKLYLGADKKKIWANMKIPTAKLSTAIFVRRKGQTWDKPGLKVIKDDLKSFPLNTIRIVNLSPYPAGITIADKKTVKIGKEEVKALPVGEEDIVKIFYQNKSGRKASLYSNLLELKKNERMHAYLYLDDGPRSRGKVRLKRFRENFRMPKPAKKTRKTAGR